MKILKDIFWTTTKITTHDFKQQHYRSTKCVEDPVNLQLKCLDTL